MKPSSTLRYLRLQWLPKPKPQPKPLTSFMPGFKILAMHIAEATPRRTLG